MGIGEALEKLKTTTESFLLLWVILSKLALDGSSNYIKTPFYSL
jgi:hypothetical protein